ncbi:Transcription factor RAX2 [Abeliophyllum distichum]|uniref:Transcription factor RAX2 n=1 Tax=Abeliophyllum distichum TaxID=126358 RepID=A0ABD1UKL6_9LAMI
MGKTPCCDKTKVRKGLWSPEEDEILKNHIEKYGTGGNWITFPQKAGLNRCGKSCRLRWVNYLRPDIKHEAFTLEEDNIIYILYSILGSKWSIIASHLQGRTDNDVKNHWNTNLKKKPMAAVYRYPTNNIETTTAAADLSTSTTNTLVPTFSAPETSAIMPCLTESSKNPSFSSSSQQDSTISETFSQLGENFMFGNGSCSEGIPMDNIDYGYEILSEIWSQEAAIEGVPNLY